MVDVNIHNILSIKAQTFDVTAVGIIGTVRITTSRGAATLFVTPEQAEAIAYAWDRTQVPAAAPVPVPDPVEIDF